MLFYLADRSAHVCYKVIVDFDRTYIGGIERGERNPTCLALLAIASAVGFKPSRPDDADGAGLAMNLVSVEGQAPVAEVVEFSLSLFENLLGAWRRMDVAGRRHVLGSMWPSGLVFDGEGFGTSLESPLVALYRGKKGEKKEAIPLLRGRLPNGLPG